MALNQIQRSAGLRRRRRRRRRRRQGGCSSTLPLARNSRLVYERMIAMHFGIVDAVGRLVRPLALLLLQRTPTI